MCVFSQCFVEVLLDVGSDNKFFIFRSRYLQVKPGNSCVPMCPALLYTHEKKLVTKLNMSNCHISQEVKSYRQNHKLDKIEPYWLLVLTQARKGFQIKSHSHWHDEWEKERWKICKISRLGQISRVLFADQQWLPMCNSANSLWGNNWD